MIECSKNKCVSQITHLTMLDSSSRNYGLRQSSDYGSFNEEKANRNLHFFSSVTNFANPFCVCVRVCARARARLCVLK